MNFTTPLYFLFFVTLFLFRWILPAFSFFPRWIPFPFLLIGSYYFYLSWDPRFGLLIFGTTLLDYSVGRGMEKVGEGRLRKFLLSISLVGNLCVLGFFKYFHFFVDSGIAVFSAFGWSISPPLLRVILPVGISFYTFQSLSYTIDVYRRQIEAERSFWKYALFLSFFPQLVAGPIVAAREFLPQLKNWVQWREMDIRSGIVLILIGTWKKAVLADNISILSDTLYDYPHLVSSLFAWLGSISYALQIYFDFSGYSDIAIGSAILLGFRLPENFRMPYLSGSFSEFWRRWHISLSSWLRDYLYIPLGGNRHGESRTYFNLIVTMVLGGLWHGASWNFVAWGSAHGLLLGIERAFRSFDFFSRDMFRIFRRLFKGFYQLFVLTSIVLIWVFFRSPDWATTWVVFGKLIGTKPEGFDPNTLQIRIFSLCFLLFIFATWIGHKEEAKGSFKAWYENLSVWSFSVLASAGGILAVLLSAKTKPFLYFVF
ncbi:hypothetical protein CH373_07550 [Leptospira perolatii]|uniref:Acyltransferase n=1 Tax=Leptospira perolatii TaxID=2023191 RepID=A0A2M9ZPS3_9LEPT|nr:MBOAT family O-acyltransferase [Leptospira perolatii]PJZ70763.1 hypothetical protein CH360_04410 [Leptospira perolatii]PJZ73971.1 hypothetical protein CH373_07550 [Leptospira perolatii]